MCKLQLHACMFQFSRPDFCAMFGVGEEIRILIGVLIKSTQLGLG